ncbi:MAG: DeoR/GlpR family DNA-binding transcription regulator [Bullifex sp.]
MDINERRQKINDMLSEREYITVEELSRSLKVSAVTIRTDLSALEAEGVLRRTHGGAMRSERKIRERLISHTMVEFEKEKKAIAVRASSFIRDGSTVIIDSGSTAIHVLDELDDVSFTIVTNNVLVIDKVKEMPNIDLVVLGGSLKRSRMGTIGPIAIQAVRQLNVDLYFMGAAAYNDELISSSDITEAELKSAMMKAADKVVFLADSSKYGKKAFATVCTWNDIDCFITDSIDREFCGRLEEMGVEVIKACVS